MLISNDFEYLTRAAQRFLQWGRGTISRASLVKKNLTPPTFNLPEGHRTQRCSFFYCKHLSGTDV